MSEERSAPRLFAVLGDPVDHSLSPALFNAGFRALGLEAIYVSIRVGSPSDAVGVMRSLARAGGGGNVTVPHKRRAAAAVERPSPAVQATGACNVFYWDEGLCGDNTDVKGFRVAAEQLLGASLGGRSVLLLGAGGAARAVLHACHQAGAERVQVLNRTPEHAEAMVTELDADSMAEVVRHRGGLAREYDLIVNATSLGLRDSDPLPLEPAGVDASALMDLVYSSESTAWVRQARELGMVAEDGRRMLVEQAAAAFELWFQREAPREAMRDAVGLGGPGTA